MSAPIVTLTGNATKDPELRYTPSGVAVAKFTIAQTERKKTDAGWEDGATIFMDVSVWREQAEQVAETVTKGMRLIVVGRLRQRSFETRDGQRRTVVEVEADEVAPSLRNASAKVQRAARSRPQSGQQAAAEDPWSTDDAAPF